MSENSANSEVPLIRRTIARIRGWAVLMRIEYVVLGTVAVVGGLTASAGYIEWPLLIALYVLNSLIVAFGFVHNDLADEEIDRRARDAGQRPLIDGSVTRSEAWVLCGFCLLAATLIHVVAIGRVSSLVAMFCAFGFAALYNIFSKKIPGADLLYGASTASVAICGFLAVCNLQSESLLTTPLALAFALATFSNNTFLNAIQGGLKDISLDRQAGVVTFAILTGVRVDNGLIIPLAFRLGAWLLRAVALAACWYPVISGTIVPPAPLLICMIVASLAALKTTVDLLHLKEWDRNRIGKLARSQEFMSRIIFVFLIGDHAGLIMCAVVVFVPIFFYIIVSALVHRKIFQNPPTF